MARQVVTDAQPRMDGGLNSISDDSVLGETQVRTALNARLTDFGAITKRGGTRRVSAALSGAPVRNGYTWRLLGGTPEILAVSGGTLYTTNWGTFPWTWTAETGTLDAAVPPTFAKFRDGSSDVVYIADGGLLNKWNGTALTTNIAGTVAARRIVVHNQRLWSCGCGVAPDSIFYSALNNGDSLGNGSAGGGEIIVRTFGDENVVALESVGSSLIIFHRKGVSRLTGFGQDDIFVAPAGISGDTGLIAPYSPVVVDGIGYFVSERGLYAVTESAVAPVSTPQSPDPLLPILRSLTAADFDNIRTEVSRATRELWITIPGFGCYVYHTILRAWTGPWDTGWVAPQTISMWETIDDDGLPVVLRGDVDGYVLLCDAPGIAVDNTAADGTGGTPFRFSVQFRRMYCGDQALSKAFRWGYLTAQLRGSTTARVTWQSQEAYGTYDLAPSPGSVWGSPGAVWGSGVWGGAGSQSYRIPMGGNGYFADITFDEDGVGLPILSSMQLQAFALGRR
jgi:hypothetical protein